MLVVPKYKNVDFITLKGEFEVILFEPVSMEVVSREVYENTVTNQGKYGAMDQILAAPTLGKPTHMAIGTGAPAANALGAEVARVALTSKTKPGGANSAAVVMVGDFPAGTPAGTNVITEYGIFDASSTGNAWNTGTSGGQSKDASLAMQVNWTFTGA